MNKDLRLVYDYQKDITLLGQTSSILGWDQLTYMPLKGQHSRSEQLSLLSQLIHKKATSNELFNALKSLLNTRISKKEALMVKKLHKDVLRSRKLPSEFIKELSKTTSLAYQAWDNARHKKDFKIFQPYLEKIIKLKKQECKYINEPGHAYNSLLDQFEEGMTTEKLVPIFQNIKKKLVVLINKIKETDDYKKQKKVLTKQTFTIDKQRKLCEDVIKRIGLVKDSSRLDLSTHPFTSELGIDDIRITTNFRDNPLFAFESTIHEAGHALYDLNLPKKEAYNILGDAPSLGIHESQSRFWENLIGKSKPFWQFYFPIFKNEFKLKGDLEKWYKEVNHVEPNFIRIESDEVTYCLHIILRFEIELGLIEGSIKVKDLPRIWNEKTSEMLGITPKNDKEGVLQDMHWSGGAIGYFPTYAIGTIYSAQLYNQLKKEKPLIENEIKRGNFSQISSWLKTNVHNIGNNLTADEIIKKTCKSGLNPEEFINYLNKKFSGIYKF